MSHGTLFIISAPSGAGKTSLVHALSSCVQGLRVSISHTTRPHRPGENHGEDYFFVDSNCFKQMIADRAFLEHAQVFGHHYGTAKEMVTTGLTAGCDVVLEIDWQGAQQVRKKMPEAVSIFILPPTLQELEKRLKERAQDSEEIINGRMSDALAEISHYEEYQFLIVNHDFDQALEQLTSIVLASRLKRERQALRLKPLLEDILGRSRSELTEP